MKRNEARILVIDDYKIARRAIVECFLGFGFMVKDARDGAKALDILANEKFDLIICDVMMPKADGLRVLMTIKHLSPAPKIIMISGASSKDHYLTTAKDMGADAVYEKPLNLISLCEKVDELLGIVHS